MKSMGKLRHKPILQYVLTVMEEESSMQEIYMVTY